MSESEVDSEVEFELYSHIHYSSNLSKTLVKRSEITDDVINQSETAVSTIDDTDDVIVIEDSDTPSNDDVILIEDSESESEQVFNWQMVFDEYKIDEKIELNVTSPPPAPVTSSTPSRPLNRFFTEDRRQCKNCDEQGHIARHCPKPPRKWPCLNCASRDHQIRSCPFNIPRPRTKYNIECIRCTGRGHTFEDCPEIWRQYRKTTKHGKIKQPDSNRRLSKRRNCFNCGATTHFGHQCRQRTMFNRIVASQLVRVYDKYTKVNDKIPNGEKFVNGKISKKIKKKKIKREAETEKSEISGVGKKFKKKKMSKK